MLRGSHPEVKTLARRLGLQWPTPAKSLSNKVPGSFSWIRDLSCHPEPPFLQTDSRGAGESWGQSCWINANALFQQSEFPNPLTLIFGKGLAQQSSDQACPSLETKASDQAQAA